MAVPSIITHLPIPSDLKTPHSQTPWRISPNLFSRISQQPSSDIYKKQELSPTDPEFPFVYHYFNHQKPTNRSISKVYCIHNQNEATIFENKLPSIETEASNSFFQSQWDTEHLPQLRQKVIDRFKAIAAIFSPFEVQFTSQRKQTFALARVLPLWHGSSAAKCDSICRSGFTFFGKHGFAGGGAHADNTDVGFFGSGIYFTTSARYAVDTYSDGENLLLGWVSMREPFPVISDTDNPSQCSDMKRLKGQGAYHKYNAHYIPVVPDAKNPHSGNYYPCPLGSQPVWDEIVVFQQSQTLVRFWVVMQVDLTKPVPGSSLTVGTLLKMVTECLDQKKVQENQQLSEFLEHKETELMALNPFQAVTQADVIFFNCMNQLIDEQKNIRERIAKKLLTPVTTSPTSSPAQPPSFSPFSSTTATHHPTSALLSNPIPSFSAMSIASFSGSALPPSTSYPASIPASYMSPSSDSTYKSSSIQPAVLLTPSLPAIAFGAARWSQYFGNVGAEPSLPSNIHEILSSPCPFWPQKKVQETHLLVLVPQTVNGKPLTLKSLGELVKAPRQGNLTQYDYFNLGEYTDPSVSSSHWVLMTRGVIDGSRSKNYTDQHKLVTQYAQKSGLPYQVPNVLDAAVCILMEHVQSGKRLYNDNPLTFTRCQEQWNKNWQLAVGGFSSAGLGVNFFRYDDGNDDVGVCGLRKF